MRLAHHVCNLAFDVVRYGIATRRVSMLVVVLLGLALLGLAFTAQAAVPLALYPFA